MFTKSQKKCSECNEEFSHGEILGKYHGEFICECCTEDIEERHGQELPKFRWEGISK